MGRNSFTVARRDYRISKTQAKRESFCVNFAQKLLRFFLKKNLQGFFSRVITRLVLRKWFSQDVKRLLGMNIKDRHHGNDAEHRNKDRKTNPQSH